MWIIVFRFQNGKEKFVHPTAKQSELSEKANGDN